MKTSTSVRSPLSPTLWPPEAFRWWRSLGLALLLIFAILVSQTIVAAFMLAFKLLDLRDLQKFTWPLVIVQLASYAVGIALLLPLLPMAAGRRLADLGLRAPRWSDLAWGIGGAIAMEALAAATSAVQIAVFHVSPEQVQVKWLHDVRGSLIPGFVFLACFAAPFFEELFFRGFLFNALLRYMTPWLAVLTSALLFGLAHSQPGNGGAVAPLAAGGIVLATVYYRSGSLVASMLTHALFNAITVVLVLVFHQS